MPAPEVVSLDRLVNELIGDQVHALARVLLDLPVLIYFRCLLAFHELHALLVVEIVAAHSMKLLL